MVDCPGPVSSVIFMEFDRAVTVASGVEGSSKEQGGVGGWGAGVGIAGRYEVTKGRDGIAVLIVVRRSKKKNWGRGRD